MKNLRFSFLLSFCTLACAVYAQNAAVIQNYIDTYKEIAIAEMLRTGVPASIKLAQGIHETTAGTSHLVLKSNNHFGIKCKSNWTGESVKHTDDALNECFRKYEDPLQSYRDHSDFLKGSGRYASLFALDPLDYSGWAYGLKKAGYATNPKYPIILVKLIETWQLQEYTLIALGKEIPKENNLAVSAVSENGEVSGMVTKVAHHRVIKRDYPQGEFKLNNTRVIYLPAGTSLLAIAQQYDVSLAKLFEFNELEETESLESDQLIFLQRKRKTGNVDFHIVAERETLKDIAREEGIRLESLLEYNHLQNYMRPSPGEQLYLRTKAQAMPRLAKTEVSDKNIAGGL